MTIQHAAEDEYEGDTDPMASNDVFLFYGAASKTCVAAFSSLQKATAWIKQYRLTGNLIKFTVDNPGFESRLAEGSLPKYIDTENSCAREAYVDNSFHWHFYYGIGEDEPEYGDAFDRWHIDNT